MAKRRKLLDLYKRGTEIMLNDGEGDPVTVWLEKLNPLDHDAALRRANAERARILIIRNDHDSEEYLSAYNDAVDFGDRDALIDYLVSIELADKIMSIEAELAADEKWSTNNMLDGLRDAWADGLDELYHSAETEEDRDSEAVRVFTALREFSTTVEVHVEKERVRLTRDYETVSDDELRTKVTDAFIETRANTRWLREYQRSLIFLAVRDPENHKEYYFESRKDVDQLATEVLDPLIDAYDALVVEVIEGKDSPQATDSSVLSERPEGAATDAPSGRMAAAH